jgi:hypothetical protein
MERAISRTCKKVKGDNRMYGIWNVKECERDIGCGCPVKGPNGYHRGQAFFILLER